MNDVRSAAASPTLAESAPAGPHTPLLSPAHGPGLPARLQTVAADTFGRLVQLQRTTQPSLHWLQGTLGTGMVAASLLYSALGSGNAAEEGTARGALVVGSHWYMGGVHELLATAVHSPAAGAAEAVASAATATGAWVGLLASAALLGSSFRPAQYAGLAAYHAAVMAASAALRHSYHLENCRQQATAGTTTRHQNTTWAIGTAAVIGCMSIAGGFTFWLTSQNSSVGALAAGTAGCHAIGSACWAMGLVQARALTQSRQAPSAAEV